MSLMENSAGLGGRIRYFLGANTPTGFVGYTDDLYDCRGGWRAFLIKSGPGTGKNTLMRAVLDAMTAHGEEAQTICCSSDPHSLDAILFDRLKLALIDATAPHIIEPKYWGAVEEIVDLGSCMDNTRMHEHADAVIELTDACSALACPLPEVLMCSRLAARRQPPHCARLHRLSQNRPYRRAHRCAGIRAAGGKGRPGTAPLPERGHAGGTGGLPRNAPAAVPAHLHHRR